MNTNIVITYRDKRRARHIATASLNLVVFAADGILIPRLQRYIPNCDILNVCYK